MRLQVTQLSESSFHCLPLYTSTHYSPQLSNPPPKSHPLSHKHNKPFIQPSILLKQDILQYVNLSLSYLPPLSVCITIYTAFSARIALHSLWAAPSTCLLTEHGFLNPTKHPSFRKANRHDQLQCANRKLRLRLVIMYVSSMNRTRNDMNSRKFSVRITVFTFVERSASRRQHPLCAIVTLYSLFQYKRKVLLQLKKLLR
jgi:hypothetical protein